LNEKPEPRGGGAQAATDAIWLVATSYLSQLLTLGLAFVLRKQLGPVGMGYVAIVTLAGTYAPLIGLGTLQAAEREIAIAIGRRDHEEAESLEAAAVRIAVLLAVIAAVVVAALGIVRGATDHLLGATLMCAAAVLLLQQFAVWAMLRLRTRYRFRALGWISALTAVSAACLNVVGALLGGAVGTLIAIGLGTIITVIIMAIVAGIKPISVRRPGTVRRLAILGPGFFASGAATILLGSIDQVSVGLLLGTTSLGIYSTAYLGYGFILRVPTLVGSVIYPRLQRQLGASDDQSLVFAMADRTTALVTVAMPAMVAVFFATLPALVMLVLPEFRAAVDPMRLLLIGLVGFSFGMPATQYLITVNRQWLQVAISVAFVGAMGSAYLMAGATGHMSLLVAGGVDAIGYYGVGIVMQVAAHRTARVPIRSLLGYMPMHLLTAAELLLCAGLTNGLLGSDTPAGIVVGAAAQVGIFAMVWLALAALFFRSHPASLEDLRMTVGLVSGALGRILRMPPRGPRASGG
jgi:O-antigen/teichoic acid export membrane protein